MRRRRRTYSRGGGWGTYLLWGGLAYLLLSRGSLGTLFGPTAAGANPTGGFIPQPYSWWINPQTSELWLADATGIPPGSVPPWRLASDAEILSASSEQSPFTPPM